MKGRSLYGQFLDGQVRLVRLKETGCTSAKNLVKALHSSAGKRKLRIITTITEHGQAVIVQAFKPGER
jgi:hypothetical protein